MPSAGAATHWPAGDTTRGSRLPPARLAHQTDAGAGRPAAAILGAPTPGHGQVTLQLRQRHIPPGGKKDTTFTANTKPCSPSPSPLNPGAPRTVKEDHRAARRPKGLHRVTGLQPSAEALGAEQGAGCGARAPLLDARRPPCSPAPFPSLPAPAGALLGTEQAHVSRIRARVHISGRWSAPGPAQRCPLPQKPWAALGAVTGRTSSSVRETTNQSILELSLNSTNCILHKAPFPATPGIPFPINFPRARRTRTSWLHPEPRLPRHTGALARPTRIAGAWTRSPQATRRTTDPRI